jgi:hypothetical protein
MLFPSALVFDGRRWPMPKLLRMAGYVHCQVVLTTIVLVGVLEFVDTVTGVINAVAFLQKVDFAVQRQPKRSAFHCDILPGTAIVGQKCPSVYTGGQGRPHELKLHLR